VNPLRKQMTLELKDAAEVEALVEALASCMYLARDEERQFELVLAAGRKAHDAAEDDLPCDDCRIADYSRAEAAKRAMRYSLLHDRALNLQAQSRTLAQEQEGQE
jgi:hypothetical protein